MTIFKTMTALAALAALGACSTATTPPVLTVPSVGAVSQQAGVGTLPYPYNVGYTVNVNGTPTDLGVPSNITSSGGLLFDGTSSTARGHTNADATAIGGMTSGLANTQFAGVSGTFGTVPTGGNATYNGYISFVYPDPTGITSFASRRRNLSLTADFSSLTIAQNADGVVIDGNISGSSFSGNVTWSGKTAPMAGGFYGTNTAAGAFSSAEMAGAFMGTKP